MRLPPRIHESGVGWRRALLCGLALLSAARVDAEPMLLAVAVNGQSVSEFSTLLKVGAQYYARAADLRDWRLQAVGEPRIEAGEAYYPLDRWQARLDTTTQTLSLDAPASAFTTQRIDLRATQISSTEPLTPATAGLALDYDLSLQAADHIRPQAAALLDINVFGIGRGGLRQQLVVRNGVGTPTVLRLDSQWRYEDPQALRTVNLGDSVTCGGELGAAARFGGVQVQRDFGLRPDLVTFPLPMIDGRASLPSAVDLLVDGHPAGSVALQPGPFHLDNPPVVTGAGEIRVVQRDLLGREQILAVPYYVSPRLLKPGLTDYCAELGRLRQNYGVNSNDYGEAFTAGSLRLGLSDELTVLTRLELGAVTRTASVGAHWLAGGAGIVSAQLAAGSSEAGSGSYAQLRFERQARAFSVAAAVEGAGSGFRWLGSGALPALRVSLFGGSQAGSLSLSAGAVWQRQQDDSVSRVLSLNLSRPLAWGWFGSASAQRQNGQNSVLLSLVRPFGERGNVALNGQSVGGNTQTSVQAQQAEPYNGGLGWQVLATEGASARQQAGLGWLGSAGHFTLEAAHTTENVAANALRVGGRGGLIWLDGAVAATRGLGDGSTALVSLPGLPGVPVSIQHRPVAVTDADGRAWISGLLPYQDNVIGIDVLHLPLDARLASDEIRVRPPSRAAVRVEFPLSQSANALLSIVDAARQPIPVGARGWLAGGTRALPFGEHGEVFVEGLSGHNHLEVRWAGQRCTVEFDAPSGIDPQPRIGPLVCRAQT
jgi:outer membrane usher protein